MEHTHEHTQQIRKKNWYFLEKKMNQIISTLLFNP